MATPIPEGHWLAKLRWRLMGDNEEVISTIAMHGSEPGEREPNTVAEAVFNAWDEAFDPINMNQDWSFVGVDVLVGSADREYDTGTYNRIVQGGMPNAVLPQNCAMLIKKKTAKAGRRNSGRMYIPSGYMAEADVSNNGSIATASLQAYQNWANGFLGNMTDPIAVPPAPATSFILSLLHSEPTDDQGNVTGPAPIPTDITSLVVDSRIATMRTRLRR